MSATCKSYYIDGRGLVDGSYPPREEGDPRNHTKQNEIKRLFRATSREFVDRG